LTICAPIVTRNTNKRILARFIVEAQRAARTYVATA